MRHTAPRKKAATQLFHAPMLVTRMEEWCVEAETAEEARRLLAAGDGYRCHIGDCVHVELHDLIQ
jgi:hypothetical protein